MESNAMLTMTEVRKRLRIGHRAVRTFAEEGRFPNAVPFSRANGVSWRIPESDVESLKDELREAYRNTKPLSKDEPSSS